MALSGPQDASNMLRRFATLECNEALVLHFAAWCVRLIIICTMPAGFGALNWLFGFGTTLQPRDKDGLGGGAGVQGGHSPKADEITK